MHAWRCGVLEESLARRHRDCANNPEGSALLPPPAATAPTSVTRKSMTSRFMSSFRILTSLSLRCHSSAVMRFLEDCEKEAIETSGELCALQAGVSAPCSDQRPTPAGRQCLGSHTVPLLTSPRPIPAACLSLLLLFPQPPKHERRADFDV